MAHKPVLKQPRARLHHLSRFLSLPETHLPKHQPHTPLHWPCASCTAAEMLPQAGTPKLCQGPWAVRIEKFCCTINFRNNSLPQFPCFLLSFPHCVTANALSWILEQGCAVPHTPRPRDTVIIIIDFPVSFMFHRVFCWK